MLSIYYVKYIDVITQFLEDLNMGWVELPGVFTIRYKATILPNDMKLNITTQQTIE